MKKINKQLSMVLLVLLLTISSFTTISAASASVSGPGTLTSGGSGGNITISTNAPGGFFQGEITGGDANIAQLETRSLWAETPANDSKSNPTQSVFVRPKGAGTTTFNVSGKGQDLQGNNFSFNVPITITVSAPVSKPTPSPSVDDPSRPKPEEKPEQKPQQESAADREAREQREKETEEARKKKEEEQKKEELEAAKLVPLVTSINVISDSDKLNGEVLTEIKTEKDKFDYEYTLPRRVDAFKLDLKSDATLDYIKDHKFSDDENEKKIVVEAKNDDFDQTINIVVKRNTDPLLERAVGDKKLKVYDDELLNKLMEEKGFELKNFKEGDVEHTFFTKGKVNVQLLVDDKGAAQWYLLDGSNKAVEPVAFFLGKEGDVLFIKSPSEELQKETLHGNKYEVKSRALPKEFTEMDKELKIENKYGAWEFEDGEIVFAMDENLEEGLFHINSKELVKSAVVAFDQVDAKMKTIAIGTSVALLGLIAANIVYVVVNKKNENELI